MSMHQNPNSSDFGASLYVLAFPTVGFEFVKLVLPRNQLANPKNQVTAQLKIDVIKKRKVHEKLSELIVKFLTEILSESIAQ